jgi:hypothetical protein
MATSRRIPAQFMKSMDPRKWMPPKEQIEDALAGNTDTDAPVTFVSKTKKEKDGE